MNKTLLKVFLRRHQRTMWTFVIAIALWYVTGLFLERYQASVGPDFIPRLFVKLFYFAASIPLGRLAFRWIFPQLYALGSRGDAQESQLDILWTDKPSDLRIACYVAARVLCYVAVCVLLALAV